MELPLDRCEIRSYRASDAESLARNADNRRVWLNLRDAFPHPYRVEDARAFIEHAVGADPETSFAIAVDDAAVGGIGVKLGTDVERVGAEIGYWLGEPYWGRGIVSEAVAAFTPWAAEAYGLTRVFALPYARNAPSTRLLEKAGYLLEGRMRKSALKDGVLEDQFLYAWVTGA